LITFPGSLFCFDSCVPSDYCKSYGCSILGNVFGVLINIMVGVAIDTIQQINSYLLNKHYDGLMKSGKIEKQ
jgi:preprotein translocase subunit SecY